MVAGRDTVLPGLPLLADYFASNLEVSRDGRRFLGVIADSDDFQLIVSPNWITEFRRRIGK
jgi:hypothetical protein